MSMTRSGSTALINRGGQLMLIIAIKEEKHSEETRETLGIYKKHHQYKMNPIKQYKCVQYNCVK